MGGTERSEAEGGEAEAQELEHPRAVADVAAAAEVTNAVEGGVGILQAAEAHRRMLNVKAANVDTPSFQGHTFEQAADAQNVRHPLHRLKINSACNEIATDATAADGTKLQFKKGYGQSDGPSSRAHKQGQRTNNRLIQERALRKLDQNGHDTGKVVTTKGDKVSADVRVEESPVSRARVEQATDRYAQALKGLSGREVAGPEYTAESNLARLRSRGLGHKRSLASREFALGIEALERFVASEPLYRVRECVFGVLALESEPVDPRF